ncbi:MAG: tetratricopeptide repeat protein [Chitinophagaceae bacterium]|nr:tetratricopeptide repeat protein [Chitinophagaceae bacterium]
MKLLITIILCLSAILSNAQENNPLINSGEVITEGVRLHDERKYKESIATFRKISRGDTNYYRAVYEMAYSQMLDSQFVEARKTCELGLAVQNDKWPDFYTLYGNLIDDMGDPARALRIYDSAIKLYPATAELYLNKGTTLMKLTRYAEAEEVFKECLLINPFQASSHYKLGVSALQQGKIIPAFLSHINYLLLQPAGRFHTNTINSLSAMTKGTETMQPFLDKRTQDQSDNFSLAEKIILSKIALDKQYKPLLKLDDPISRQIQVLFEKLEYDEKDPDFYMQYYVPFFKKMFEEKKFEPFIFRLFANVNIESIQDYHKKNKKEVQDVVNEVSVYHNVIRLTRELNYATRIQTPAFYHFDDGGLFGRGKTADNGEKLVGDWEFYYPSGNLRTKTKYNASGERDGTWTYYHFSGIEKGKEKYKDGKQEGDEIFYFDNGVVSSTSHYKDGLEDGVAKGYYRVGTPRTVVPYKGGKINGERRTYFANGNLQSIENYLEDSLEGPFKTFHQNGAVESKRTYKDGKQVGVYSAYHDNGQLSMEGSYANDELDGMWKQYHENGKLRITQTYAGGKIEGAYSEYYDNGQLFFSCTYKNGKVSGDVEYFDRDGKRFFIYSFDNDNIKQARYFDKTGKEIGSSERKAKSLNLTTYYSDGFKRSQVAYNSEGEQDGMEKYFYRSGATSSEIPYKDGLIEGTGLNYHPNGKMQAASTYVGGDKHGYDKFWYIHGQLQEEGWQQEGELEGRWFSYNEQGNLTFISEYLNGDLHGYKEEFFPNGKKNNEFRYHYGWIEEFKQFDTLGKEINHYVLKNGDGKFKVVYFNGKTFGEGTYVDGELEGAYKFSFFDGSTNTIQHYKRGELDSTFKNYYYGGQIANEGKYKFGNKVGVWKNYMSTGQLNFTETYVDGEMTGKKIFLFDNGKTDSEIEMQKGERHGWTKKYDKEGGLMYQVRFDEDLPVAYSYMDKSGKLVPEIAIPGGTGKVTAFYANGTPSSSFEYADGIITGENVSYYPNGKLMLKGTENYGLSEGTYKYYYPNGQLQLDYVFLHDNLHGFYKEYNDKGIVTEEGYYFNGTPHNKIRHYDDAGKLKETRVYYYGQLLDVK